MELTATERRVLAYLAGQRDQVVSKTQILTAVWGYDGFDDNVVEVYVSALRRKLEAAGRPGCCTRSAGAGYRLSADPVRTGSTRLVARPGSPLGVIAVLAVVLLLVGGGNAVFVAQSERNLDALLNGRAQLARQLARAGVGPQQIVNRVSADGVQGDRSSCGTGRRSAPRPTRAARCGR